MALFLDGKSFAEATLAVSFGVTLTGKKRFIDGGQVLRGAVKKTFGRQPAVQRYQWHQLDGSAVNYLSKSEHADWRRHPQRARNRPTHAEAASASSFSNFNQQWNRSVCSIVQAG